MGELRWSAWRLMNLGDWLCGGEEHLQAEWAGSLGLDQAERGGSLGLDQG